MVTTNAQQTPALRNRNLTCSTRPRGATRQPWLGARRSPGSPRVPPATSWGSAAPRDGPELRQKSCRCAQLQLGEPGLLSCLLLPSPAGAAAGWILQLVVPGFLCGAAGWEQSPRHQLRWGVAGRAQDKAVPSARLNHPPRYGSPSYCPRLKAESWRTALPHSLRGGTTAPGPGWPRWRLV